MFILDPPFFLEKQFFCVKILIFFDADPGSGMEKFRSGIRDGEKIGSGFRDGKSRIRDKHPGSAILLQKLPDAKH
jgi:hypothetical protein